MRMGGARLQVLQAEHERSVRLALVLPVAATACRLEPCSCMRTDETSLMLALILLVAATACRLEPYSYA